MANRIRQAAIASVLALWAGVAMAQPLVFLQTGSITAGGADCSVAARCVSIADLAVATAGTLAIDVRGTFSATLTFEATVDGTNFFTLHVIDQSDGSDDTTTTAAGQWSAPIAGYRGVRARASAYTSGTATVTLVAPRTVGSAVRTFPIAVASVPADQTVDLNKVVGTTATVNNGAATAGTLRVIEATSTTYYPGTNTTSVTPEALAATQAVREVLVQNDPDSATDVLVGNSASQPIQLAPGGSLVIPASDLANIWIAAVSGTPTVNFLGRN